MPIKLLLISALLFALGASAASATTCDKDDIKRAAERVDDARRVLLALPVGDGLETRVSSKARQAIVSMKSRLGDFVDTYMRCAPLDVAAETIERELSDLAHAVTLENRVYENGELPKEAWNYGFQLGFEVKTWDRGRRLIGIVANFQIECGSDATLLVFADEGAWREVMRWQSKPYDKVSGAFGSFDYALSPINDAGEWYVVAKNIAPWCSSAWSFVRYAVLRPTVKSIALKVLYTGNDSIWWGDDNGQLTVDKGDFDLRFHSWSIDPVVHNRVWIRHFSVTGDKVRRIQPVAVSPRDFADEWVTSAWEEASRWSPKKAIHRLKSLHEKLHALAFEFGSIHRCLDRPDHYQVELQREDEHWNYRSSYFLHVIGATDFSMENVLTSPAAVCDGEDILGTMETQ